MKASLPYHYITAVKNGKQYVVFDYKDKSVSASGSQQDFLKNALKRH